MTQQDATMNNIPRPRENDPDVMAAAVEHVLDGIQAWADANGIVNTDELGGNHEFKALMTIAVMESVDGYGAARYVDTMFDWPADTALVKLLDAAYRTAPLVLPDFVKRWVMATGTRFPAKKGNSVKVRIGDAEFSGVVTDILESEARGWVEVLNAKVKGKVIAINSEEVIKVTSTGDGRMPTPPSTPTGGTPVAARTHGEKLLKELRVA